MLRSPPDPLYVLRGDASQIHSLLFSITPLAEILYAGDTNGTVHVWNLKTNKKIASFSCSDVACLSMHSIGDLIVTQDKRCTLKGWKIVDDNFACLFTRDFNNVSFCKVDVYRDNDPSAVHVAIPQPNSIVLVCRLTEDNVEECKSIGCATGNEGDTKFGEVMQIKFVRREANEKLMVVILYENGNLIARYLSDNRIVFAEKFTTDTMPTCFDVDAIKLQIVCGTADKWLIFAKFDDNWSSSKRKRVEITNPGVGRVLIRPDGKIVAAGCWDGRLRIFSWSSCKLLAVLNYHTESVLDVCFSEMATKYWKSNHLLAAGGADCKISLWSIYE